MWVARMPADRKVVPFNSFREIFSCSGARVRFLGAGVICMGMTQLALRDALREFAAALRLHDVIPMSEFETGLVHIEAEAGASSPGCLFSVRPGRLAIPSGPLRGR